VVALEGWRRGLTLKWHVKDSEKFKEMKTWFVDKPGKLFSLSSSEKTHYFFRTRGDKVTNEAVEMGMDKEITKQKLMEANIPTPIGKEFPESASDEEIIAYANELGYPVVIKPTDGSFGRGVVTNITTEEELVHQLTYIRETQGYRGIITEQYIPGKEYRLYVVGDNVVAAMNRVPAHVVGDGETPVRQLIVEKNKEQESNPRLVSCPSKVDPAMIDFIDTKGYTLDSVLEEGEQLFLTEISNISTGGDPVSVTGALPKEVEEAAVRALHTIPGLEHGAVDLIIDDRKPVEEAATILELNPTAQIGGLLYPVQGKANDVAAAIIDYYFPETKPVNKEQTKLYFDFTDVLYPLLTKSANTSTVTPYPQGKLYAKKYTVSGDVQDIGYHRGLRKQAFERFLSGLVLNLNNGDIEVVVAGTDPEMVDDFQNALWEDPERSDVHEVHVESWDAPIKIGFEVKADLKTQIEDLKKIRQDYEVTELQLRKAEKEHKRYYNSLSWKVTLPVRMVGQIVKKMKRINQ